jgi:hypothetical protein
MEDFKTNHNKHGIALGTLTAIVLKLTEKTDGLTAVVVGTAIGYGSAKYMQKYGHGLPGDEEEYPSTLKPYQLSNR